MSHRSFAVTVAIALTLMPAIVFTPALVAAGQTRRRPDGQPDIQGVYKSFTAIPVEAPTGRGAPPTDASGNPIRLAPPPAPPATAGRGAEASGRGGPSQNAWWGGGAGEDHQRAIERFMIVDPPDGNVPYQPWALTKRAYIRAHLTDDRALLDVRTRCLPSSVPRANFASINDDWQIIQPPGFVVILYEFNHVYRVIPLDGRPHVGKDVQLWMGDSRGHWEGQTLVVDVTNFNDKPWVVGPLGGTGAAAGSFHSPALHVVERFTIGNAGTIAYEATIEDPNVFTRPWKIAFQLWTPAKKGTEIYEFACHEGEHDIDYILPSATKN